MDNNFADAASTTISASSYLTGFPASNIINTARTKYWKAGGNFEIHNDNNKFYINDGSPKTITLTNGSYTGEALAFEIDNKLNIASTGWTFTYSDSTYMFTVNHASATIVFSNSTDAVWDTIGFIGTSDEILSGSDLDSDEIRIHNLEYIDFDLSTSIFNVEFIALLGPLQEPIALSENSVVKLLADNIPLSPDVTPLLSITLTRNDRGYFYFLDDIDDTNYRYWRITIEDPTNGNGPNSIAIGYVYLGDYITFASTNLAIGFGKQLIDTSSQSESESGRQFFNKRSPYNTLSGLQIMLPTRSERLTFEQFVYDFGISDPFFISLDPGTCISDDLYELTYFVNFSEIPSIDHKFLDYYDIQSFSVREVV
jgi:hypothetical protein